MDNKILLQDLAQGVSARSSIQKKDADNFVRSVFDIIIQYLQSDRIVKIKGLGTFKVIEVSGRDSVNVNTGERIHISGHSKISFTPDAALRDQVNRPFAEFETIIINDGTDLAEMERLPEDLPETDAETEDAEEVVENAPAEAPEPEGADTEDVAARIEENTPVENQAETTDSTKSEQASSASDIETTSAEQDEKEAVTETSMPTPEVGNVSESVEDASSEVITDTATESEIPSEPVSQAPDTTEKEVEHTQTAKVYDEDLTEGETEDDYFENEGQHKFVYLDSKPCHFCKVCFVLLTLCLMALSYLAGFQRWFIPSEESASAKEEPVANVIPSKPDIKEDIIDKDTLTEIQSETKDSVASSAPSQLSAANSAASASAQQQPASIQTQAKPVQTQSATTKTQTSNTKPAAKPAVESIENDKNQPMVYKDGNYEISGVRCTHVMKEGEGLYRIARQYYGNMNMAAYIIKYNHISNPNVVSVGTVLKIPELRRVQ